MNSMGKLSLFQNYSSKIPLMEESVGNIVKTIRCGEALRSITERYRQSGAKAVKEDSPLFAVACLFEGGKSDKHVTGLTGLTMVDVDGVEPETVEELRAKANADAHTLFSYKTISNRGLRIVCAYEPGTEQGLDAQKKEYAAVFAACNDYYERLLGVKTDRKCKNVTRLSGMAYDPLAYHNPGAEAFTRGWIEAQRKDMEETQKADRKRKRDFAKVERLYEDTLKGELEADGAVYAPGNHNDYVMRLGYKLNQFGIAIDAAVAWAVERFPDYEATEQVIRSCYRRTEEHGSRKTARQSAGGGRQDYATVAEIKAFLRKNSRLRKNVITQRYECQDAEGKWVNITDSIVNTLWMEMSATKRVNVQDVHRVIESGLTLEFHPFLDYLKRLPEWNEKEDKDYIAELAATVTVKGGEEKQRLFERYLRKWLVAMVKSWIDSETVNNVILVLIGEQGAYKTTWFNYLLPPDLQQYFRTKTNSQRMMKDDLLALAQYGLICCEELDTMKPAELNQLKAAVTMKFIDERAAYARYAEHLPHIASFCGTGNNIQFLSDPTGNRRWLPFEVEAIRSPREHPFNYEGIYSQAYTLMKNNFEYWFSPKEVRDVNKHNKRYETPKLEHELVMAYFEKPYGDRHGEFMSVARILQTINGNMAHQLTPKNVGLAMKELGFASKKSNNLRGYIVVPRTASQIHDNQVSMAVNAEDDD